MIKIGLASDHKGFDLKEKIKEILTKEYELLDYGCFDNSSVDYPDMALNLGNGINKKEVNFGICICGTGIGISIAMNKIINIRCALLKSEDEAYLTRLHNNSNSLALSSNTSLEESIKIIKKFLTTNFSNDERHIRRIEKIAKMENR